jgi:Peptidase family C25
MLRLPLGRAGLRLLACLVLTAAPGLNLLNPLNGGRAQAATTGSTNLLMPQATGAESQFGDFITSNFASGPGSGGNPCPGCTAVPLDTIYRYYIEVPSGLSRLRIQIYDADFGANTDGAEDATGAAQRDRRRHGTFNSKVKYTLIRPDGTTVATQTCDATGTPAFCADKAWSSILDTTTTPIQSGHWELDVDQSSAVNTGATINSIADINAIGIQADDGSQTDATEIPVYYLGQNQIGQNLTSSGTAGTKNYTFYPYITSGCSFAENDFDFDRGNGGGTLCGGTTQSVGSIQFTSRSGSFTKTFDTCSVSQNDVWASNSVSGYTTDTDAVDYGIWTMAAGITNYTTTSLQGNYANIYIASSSAAAPPPADNAPTANSFRVYFGTDAGGTPVKPYMKQEVRYTGTGTGPNPPAVSSTTILTVTVQVVNPTANAITFSASNLVTVNVPGSGATYNGNTQTTQGTIVSQPAVGGTGNITWNPGTVAAGATALLAYQVNVKPTSAGQRIPVVGTVASGNGTTGKWVDETGNTTQTRATMTFGPLCELAATAGVISAAEVVDLHATAGSRGVVVEWQTVAEIASAGFDLYRQDPATREWRKVNRALILGLPGAPQGGNYRVIDDEAPAAAGTPLHYLVVETETSGARRHYPFHVEVQAPAPGQDAEATSDAGEGNASRTARRDPAWAQRFAAAASASAAAPLGGAAPASEGVDGGSFASGNASLEIGVRGDGIYRIDAGALGPVFSGGSSGAKTPSFSLTSQGQPVAWTPDGHGGILFYGQASTSIYSRDNVYWLRAAPGVQMSSVSGGNPTTAGSASASFTDSVHSEQESFAATTVPADPDSDYWYWDSLLAGDPTYGAKGFTILVPNVNAAGGSLTVNLGAAVDAQNHVQVSLNGTVLGDASWFGAVPHSATFPVTGWNSSGSNTVGIKALLDPGVASSIVFLQSFDTGYGRAFVASGDALVFRGSSNSPVTVSGFSGPAIRVFDISNPRLPAVVTGTHVDTTGGSSRVTLKPSTPSTPYLAAGPTALRSPAWLKLVGSTNLAQQPGGADYLILTNTQLAPAATALAALRSYQGLRTAVIDVADVMNAFNYGLSSPHAIHSFLSFVHATWNPVPRYVVLAGAGTFDYRNLQGYGGNLLPPLMVSTPDGLYASDNRLADVDGDGVPDFAIGRVPVVSAAELLAYVAKLAAYEGTPGGTWINNALMLADETGPNDGVTSFAGDSNAILANMPPGYVPQSIVVTPGGVGAARTALFGGLANGAGLVNYFGHAGLDRLSSEGLLTTTDVPTLNNGPRLPLMTALTCYVNRFDVPGVSPLGQVLTLQPRGGAIAVWSSSGPSVHPEAKALAQTFTYSLANSTQRRLGDVVQEALKRYAATPGLTETLDFYTLLGDPAILLKPVVPTPPTRSMNTSGE